MNTKYFLSILILGMLIVGCVENGAITPDLSRIRDADTWTIHNRDLIDDKEVHLNAEPGDGFLKLNDLIFSDGTIELDIKGLNAPGQSFVGMAFHGVNDSTYDVVYFRPFNFQNPERNNHSVQYVSHPKYTWRLLRENHPEEFENSLDIVPEPEDWFHVKIVVADHEVKAYVENSDEPSLSVKMISHNHQGWIGFWAGFNSEGWFRNLKITHAKK